MGRTGAACNEHHGVRRSRHGSHPRLALVLLVAVAVASVASACASDPAETTTTTSKPETPTATTDLVIATEPAVPPATKDCGSTSELAGWPTTTSTPPSGYQCIVDALAAGTPAQMSAITVGRGDSGRKTQDGYDLPTKQIFTWLVVGKHELRETIDRTEDGGSSTTRTCAGLSVNGPHPQGTDCS
jgi:hypothetical protein